MEENYYKNSMKSRNIAIIISFILLIILVGVQFYIIDNLFYKDIKHPQKTIGTIKKVDNIHKDHTYRISMNYSADFTIEYEVNNKKYLVTTRLHRSLSMDMNKYGKSNNGWLPGDKLKIIYDEDDPTNIEVDNSYTEKKTCFVLGIIASLIFLDIQLGKRKERKAKAKLEKEKTEN